jgi:peptidyl-prolyl cis-trans isomerase SurA
MKTQILTTYFILFFIFFTNAQIKNDDVLFTVGDAPVLASEFLRVYNKNLDLVKDESQKDVDEYLKLFVNYKLKLAEARALNFHKKPQYVREFNGYKKQLAKNYLTDHEVTDALVKEAYDRISYDVKAKHILIRINPSQKDTLATYNRLLKLRERLRNEDFDALQKEIHNGNTVLVEDLGYFSGFKMVYDFESVAFNTNIGEVSMPFRTQFGYHIVKVFDKRKSRGEVTVGHIMISNNQKDSTIKPEERIQEIYKLINQGQNFESLAKQFSDDESSANNGGKLSPFIGGQLSSPKFEDVAFSLNKVGEVSEPFQSDYGWHIIKLYNNKPIASFDKMKYELENKVRRDARSKLINTSLQNKLKKQYNISSINPARSYFVSILNDTYYNRAWKIPSSITKESPLLKIGDTLLTYYDFANFLYKRQKAVNKQQSFQDIVDTNYEAFINSNVLVYHEQNLENENIEFAQILSEYREGLLLFDLMETKIWNAVKKDTLGIQNYYNANKDKYKWEQRIDAVVATSAKEKDIKVVEKMLNVGSKVEEIKAKLNQDNTQKVIFTSGIMTATHQALPKTFNFKEGISKIYFYNDAYHIIKTNKVLPQTNKSLEEVKGSVISDYQYLVEKNWLKELEEKYEVKINQDILGKVKSQINN